MFGTNGSEDFSKDLNPNDTWCGLLLHHRLIVGSKDKNKILKLPAYDPAVFNLGY